MTGYDVVIWGIAGKHPDEFEDLRKEHARGLESMKSGEG